MKSKFRKGDRVTMTPLGIKQELQGRSNYRTGIVTKVLSNHLITVRRHREFSRHERWSAETWHEDFWRVVTK